MANDTMVIGGVKFWWANGLFHIRIGNQSVLLGPIEASELCKFIYEGAPE